MTNADKFLSLYREYETLLRDAGVDYKELEDSCEDVQMQNRLRINRQLRNYLTHNHDAGFLDISEKQIAYLEALILEQKQKGDILKKYIKTIRTGCVSTTDKLVDVLTKFTKLKQTKLLVLEQGCPVGIVNVYDVMKAYLAATRPKTEKLSAVKSMQKRIPYVDGLTSMEQVLELHESVICCTDNGTKDGKVLGVYYGAET